MTSLHFLKTAAVSAALATAFLATPSSAAASAVSPFEAPPAPAAAADGGSGVAAASSSSSAVVADASSSSAKAASSSVSAATTTKMYMLSDVHLDLFFGTPQAVGTCTSPPSSATTHGRYGAITCDGSLPLITSAMDDMFNQSLKDSNSVFLLLGDVLRHNIDVFAEPLVASSSEDGNGRDEEDEDEEAALFAAFKELEGEGDAEEKEEDKRDQKREKNNNGKEKKRKKDEKKSRGGGGRGALAVNRRLIETGEDAGLAAARRRAFGLAATSDAEMVDWAPESDSSEPASAAADDESNDVDNGEEATSTALKAKAKARALIDDYYRRFARPLRIAADSTAVIARLIRDRLGSVRSVIPHANLLSAVGNNDCVPHYFMEKMKNVAAVVNFTRAFYNSGLVSATEQAEWEVCGYYSRLVNSTNGNGNNGPQVPALVLNINSVFYSDKVAINGGGTVADPCGQFLWMTAEMQRAREKGWRVIIIGHVVPIVGKWLDGYITTYTALLKANNDVISAQFFSHTHMFTFLCLTSDDSTAPIFDIPAITPISGSNPSYVAVAFNADWRVTEVHHRYLHPDFSSSSSSSSFAEEREGGSSSNNGEWVDGVVFGHRDFSYAFPTQGAPLSTSLLYQYAISLLLMDKKDTKWQQFQALHHGGFMSPTIVPFGNKEKRKVVCRMISRSEAELLQCRGKD